MRRRVFIFSAIFLVLVLSVPAAAIYWLCYTEAGLQWLVARAEGLRNVKMSFEGVEGRLSGPIRIERFELDHARVRIVATDVRTQVDLHALVLQTIQADSVSLASVNVELHRRTTPSRPRAPRFLPTWLRISAGNVNVANARVLLINGRVLEAAPIATSATMTTGRLSLDNARVQSGPYRIAGSLDVIAANPVGLEGDFEWLVSWPEQPQYAGRVELDGDLDELRIDAAVARPFAVAVTGTARALTQNWTWKASTRAEGFDLTPWQRDSKLGRLSARLEAEGDKDNLAVSGVVTPADLPTGPIQVNLQGGIEGRRLRTDSLVLKLPARGGELHAQGGITFDGGPPTIDLKGRWNKLGWPLEAPTVKSDAGTFSLHGPLPYAFTVDGTVQAPRGITAEVQAQGQLDRTTVTANTFSAQTLGGTVQGDGSVSWANDRPWQARLAARGLDPATVHEAFDGRVSFQLAGRGRGFDTRGSWRLDLESVRGRLRSQPLSGRASVQREGKTFHVRDTDLRYGSAHLVADGVYGRERNLHVELVADDLSKVSAEAQGSLDLRADLQGTEQKPELGLNLRAQNIEYKLDETRYGVKQVEAEADIDLSDREPSWLRLTASDLGMDERHLQTLSVTVDGQASSHDLVIRADAGNADLELETHAGYKNQEWAGELQRLSLAIGEVRMALAAPTRFLASRKRAQIASFCLTDEQRRVCGEGKWQESGRWLVEATADRLPLRLLAAGLPRPSEYSGTLALDARASGEPGRPWTGNARVDFTDGVFRYERAGGKVESIEIGTGRAEAAATAEAFTAKATLNAAETAALDANLRAERRAGAPWRTFPLSGTAKARTTELGFVPIVLPEIDRASGELRADLKFSGTLGAPQVAGSLILDKGEMDLYAINLLLREIFMRLDLAGETLKLSARLRAGKGTAAMEGELAWADRKPHGTLKFTGENLELFNVPEARIIATPSLRFRIDGRRIDVDGAVRVPFARLAPANLTGAALPSEDEIIVGEQQTPPENRFNVTTGIHVILGDDVEIESYGLSGQLKGGVLAYSASGEVSTGIGEINIEDGKYVLYTRELEIERGRLIFSGGPLGDPGVDLRAIKRMPEVIAGVHVRGTLRQPRLSFFSDPPLGQNQIASLLITGRSLDSLQDEGAQSAGQSRGQLLAQGGALIAGRLGEQLGLKDLTVESGEESSLVLGTYLSPRLYVSYGISFAESINTFKLRYTIGDRWTLKSESGENKSADLVYTIEPDARQRND